MFYDSKKNENWDINNKILIFTTDANLNRLNESAMWFADGTFKSVPNLCHQLYTIHGSIDDTVYPFLYNLMCNKAENSYSVVLNQCTQTKFTAKIFYSRLRTVIYTII